MATGQEAEEIELADLGAGSGMEATNGNTSNGGGVGEDEPFLNPPVLGADIGREGGSEVKEKLEAGSKSVKNVAVRGHGVRCCI